MQLFEKNIEFIIDNYLNLVIIHKIYFDVDKSHIIVTNKLIII